MGKITEGRRRIKQNQSGVGTGARDGSRVILSRQDGTGDSRKAQCTKKFSTSRNLANKSLALNYLIS